MENFKEFQGRDLDECIRQAMEWFDCPRETLEVDILQDAKSGIFGIVGARKAKIRARRAHVVETVRNILGNPAPGKKLQIESRPAGNDKSVPATLPPEEKSRPADKRENQQPEKQPRKNPVHGKDQSRKKVPPEPAPAEPLEEDEYLAEKSLAELDREKLISAAMEIVGNLVRPIAGREVDIHVQLEHNRPRVRIAWEGDAGLLIGREGQTLAALQYLASRMLSRAMGASLRVQLDIGEYRMRQDDKLRELARVLAEKVRKTGRPCSTKPLSSYHRRVIHLCLQPMEDIQTRSTGEGAMKRVLISPRRS